MAASTGIVLTATAIAGGNEWLQTQQIPWRIGAAGLVLSLGMAGLEKISTTGAVGISSIMLITVLVTPFHGKSPVQEIADVMGLGKK